MPKRGDRAAFLPRIQFLLIAVGASQWVAIVVTDDPVSLGFDQSRSRASASPDDGVAGDLPDGQHVVAIDSHAGDAIGSGSGRDLGIASDELKWSGGGVEVVFADKKHAGLLGSREIKALVKRSVVYRTVAEERCCYALGAAGASAESGTHGVRNAAADDTVGAKDTVRPVVNMHAAAATAATARGLGVELGHERGWRQPFGQRVTVAAVRAGDPIIALQVRTHADRHSLLANVEVNKARHLAGLVTGLRGKFELTQLQHLLIETEKLGRGRRS